MSPQSTRSGATPQPNRQRVAPFGSFVARPNGGFALEDEIEPIKGNRENAGGVDSQVLRLARVRSAVEVQVAVVPHDPDARDVGSAVSCGRLHGNGSSP
jgi:hypothetical protein